MKITWLALISRIENLAFVIIFAATVYLILKSGYRKKKHSLI